jgi:hypothetical protein
VKAAFRPVAGSPRRAKAYGRRQGRRRLARLLEAVRAWALVVIRFAFDPTAQDERLGNRAFAVFAAFVVLFVIAQAVRGAVAR